MRKSRIKPHGLAHIFKPLFCTFHIIPRIFRTISKLHLWGSKMSTLDVHEKWNGAISLLSHGRSFVKVWNIKYPLRENSRISILEGGKVEHSSSGEIIEIKFWNCFFSYFFKVSKFFSQSFPYKEVRLIRFSIVQILN